MNDLSTRLRDGDPVRLEPGLPPDARDAIRRAVVAAAETGAPSVPQWRQPLALAAMTTLAVCAATAAYRFSEERDRAGAVLVEAVPPAATQVEFRTPGGTRIIWTLDPAFHLGGTRP